MNHKKVNMSVATAFSLANPKTAKQITNTALVLGVISIVVIGGTLYYQLYWKHRFKKISFDSKSPKSNISSDVASIKAKTIYDAMYGIGTGFSKVSETLSGVNRNGFIAIYNAFGKRRPADTLAIGSGSNMTLIEWFHNQFSEKQLAELRFLVNGTNLF